MEGIKILNQYEIVTDYGFGASIFGITVLVAGVIGLFIGISCQASGHCDEFDAFMILIFSTVIGAFIGIIVCCAVSEPTKTETHYEVWISENANIIEFTDKYEILDQRGQIFVVREKLK